MKKTPLILLSSSVLIPIIPFTISASTNISSAVDNNTQIVNSRILIPLELTGNFTENSIDDVLLEWEDDFIEKTYLATEIDNLTDLKSMLNRFRDKPVSEKDFNNYIFKPEISIHYNYNYDPVMNVNTGIIDLWKEEERSFKVEAKAQKILSFTKLDIFKTNKFVRNLEFYDFQRPSLINRWDKGSKYEGIEPYKHYVEIKFKVRYQTLTAAELLDWAKEQVNEELKKENQSLSRFRLESQSGETKPFGMETKPFNSEQRVESNKSIWDRFENTIKAKFQALKTKPDNFTITFAPDKRYSNRRKITYRYTNEHRNITTVEDSIQVDVITSSLISNAIEARLKITPGAYIDKSFPKDYTPIPEEKVVDNLYETFPVLTFLANPDNNEILYINDQEVPVLNNQYRYEFKDLKASTIGETKLRALETAKANLQKFNDQVAKHNLNNEQLSQSDKKRQKQLEDELQRAQNAYDRLNTYKIEIKAFDETNQTTRIVYSKEIQILSQLDQKFEAKFYAWNPEENSNQKELLERWLKDPKGNYILDSSNNRIPNPKYNPNINAKTGSNIELVVLEKYSTPGSKHPWAYFTDGFFNLQDPLTPEGVYKERNWTSDKSGVNSIIAEAQVVYGGVKFDISDNITNLSVYKLEDGEWIYDEEIDIDWDDKLSFFKQENNVFSQKGVWLFSVKSNTGLAKYKVFNIKEPDARNEAVNDEVFSKLVSHSRNFWEHSMGKHLSAYLRLKYNYSIENIKNLSYSEVMNYWKEYFSNIYNKYKIPVAEVRFLESRVKNFISTHYSPEVIVANIKKHKQDNSYPLLPNYSRSELQEYLQIVSELDTSYEKEVSEIWVKYITKLMDFVLISYPEYFQKKVLPADVQEYNITEKIKLAFMVINELSIIDFNDTVFTVEEFWNSIDFYKIVPELLGNNLKNYLIKNKITERFDGIENTLWDPQKHFFYDIKGKNIYNQLFIEYAAIEKVENSETKYKLTLNFKVKDNKRDTTIIEFDTDAYLKHNKSTRTNPFVITLEYDLSEDISGAKTSLALLLNNKELEDYLKINQIDENSFNSETKINEFKQSLLNQEYAFFNDEVYKYANLLNFSIKPVFIASAPRTKRININFELKDEYKEQYELLNSTISLKYNLDEAPTINKKYAPFHLNVEHLEDYLIANKITESTFDTPEKQTDFRLLLNNPRMNFFTEQSYEYVLVSSFKIEAKDPQNPNIKTLTLKYDLQPDKQKDYRLLPSIQRIHYNINEEREFINEYNINGIENIKVIPHIDIEGETDLNVARNFIKDKIVEANPTVDKNILFISDTDIRRVIANKNISTVIKVRNKSSLNSNSYKEIQVFNTVDEELAKITNTNLTQIYIEPLNLKGITTKSQLKNTIIDYLNAKLAKHHIIFERMLKFENELYLNSLLRPNNINRLSFKFLPKVKKLTDHLSVIVSNDLTGITTVDEYNPNLDISKPKSNAGFSDKETIFGEVENDEDENIIETVEQEQNSTQIWLTAILCVATILTFGAVGIWWIRKRRIR
ncbi:Mbov_0399 family ICE element protein [Mycoplasma sp. 4404]|uniref:Mbov_0399 family ICE element protein n=1 Tax=Mycoplasma sp. 4404 TaxID=3108530 RepID=UPI002B1E1834|nr:hypothetical protein [Mycoplasma sp. 4404]MEA4162621.1 hypothetical protein [Mycoplasma sp. 4404]